jgi:general secretion pathway protein K
MTRRRRSRSQPASNKRAPRGIALIAVLWAVMLLALMAQSFTSDVRTETQLTRNLMANGEARALADAAVHAAIDRLLRERSDANRAYDGSPYRTTLGGASVEVAIQDESGKIDLNAAPAQLLEKLFTGSGMEPDAARALVDAVADWRDRDTLRRLNGAEQGDYRLADRPYEPKNKAFDSIAELRLVLGVSPSLFERIRDAITVHSRRRGIDPRSATPTVLAALLGDDSRARDVIEARRGAVTAQYLHHPCCRENRRGRDLRPGGDHTHRRPEGPAVHHTGLAARPADETGAAELNVLYGQGLAPTLSGCFSEYLRPNITVIPANAGIRKVLMSRWIPAFAGMTFLGCRNGSTETQPMRPTFTRVRIRPRGGRCRPRRGSRRSALR